MSHITCHSYMSHYLLYINSRHHLYNITALNQLPLPSQVVHSTQQLSWSSSSSTYIGIASTTSLSMTMMWRTKDMLVPSTISWRYGLDTGTRGPYCLSNKVPISENFLITLSYGSLTFPRIPKLPFFINGSMT